MIVSDPATSPSLSSSRSLAPGDLDEVLRYFNVHAYKPARLSNGS
jgi:hypothetical protein